MHCVSTSIHSSQSQATTATFDLAAAVNPGNTSWVTIEGSYGNGFLRRLEHRQQYKINGERLIEAGQHRFTILGIGYFGTSYVPGLVPIGPSSADYPNVGDTVDPRQKEQTHTALVALNDEWALSGRQQFQFSGFFRTYNLSRCTPDFGQGLIRQSEFRNSRRQQRQLCKQIQRQFFHPGWPRLRARSAASGRSRSLQLLHSRRYELRSLYPDEWKQCDDYANCSLRCSAGCVREPRPLLRRLATRRN